MKVNKEKELSSHFRFGQNWENYTEVIDQARIDSASVGMNALLTDDEIRDKTFLDIGCGSGIHSLVALLKGARYVHSVDIDPDSVNATKSTLQRFYKGSNYKVEEKSVFDSGFVKSQKYDIVYSWGVLHHTGSMMEAIGNAASMVNDNGRLVLALYSKTRLCGMWKVEKKLYTKGGRMYQGMVQRVYNLLFRAQLLFKGKSFKEYVDAYGSQRGMSFYHDVHDWLGGYPYESISEGTLTQFLEPLGFERVRGIPYPGSWGFWGTGCFEVTYRKR
jgi:SAM-dependent methyltransferase